MGPYCLLQGWIFMNCSTFLMEIGVNIMTMSLWWLFLWREGSGDHQDNCFCICMLPPQCNYCQARGNHLCSPGFKISLDILLTFSFSFFLGMVKMLVEKKLFCHPVYSFECSFPWGSKFWIYNCLSLESRERMLGLKARLPFHFPKRKKKNYKMRIQGTLMRYQERQNLYVNLKTLKSKHGLCLMGWVTHL